MRALSLLLLTLLAGPALAQDSAAPTGCKEDNSDCREDCTVEYGSSSRTYSKLGSCLQQCKTKYDLCRERHIVLQERENLNLEPIPAAPVATPAPREVSRPSAPLPENDPADDLAAATDGRRDVYRADPEEPKPAAPAPAAPSPKSPPADGTVRRDVYRTSTPEPNSVPEPTKAPEPVKTVASEPDPLNDGVPPPAPPPPPKPKPVDPPRPKPPPEPKKDIADWDPNGD